VTGRGVRITADFSREWTDGPLVVSLLRGNCRIRHGNTRLSAESMVIWRKSESTVLEQSDRLLVYLERDARIEQPGSTLRDSFLFWDVRTTEGVVLNARNRMRDAPAEEDPLYRRAERRRRNSVESGGMLQPTQLTVPQSSDEFLPQLLSLQNQRDEPGVRRVRIFPRSAVSFSVQSFESKETTPPEQVWVLTGGMNMIIDGVEQFGVVDLSADRMVVWTQTTQDGDFQTETVQSQQTPFEVYMEGNIVIRQGRNVIRAERATYDARENRGLILDAELRAFVPALEDRVRIRAGRMRQLSRNSFHAQNAWTTTSKFGFPGYRLQATDVLLENRRMEPLFGATRLDPATGEPVSNELRWMTSLNNVFFIENVPLFYLPYLSAPAEDPNIPLKRLSVGHDRIFGGQLRTAWDMFGLLGREQPDGIEWLLLADGLTDRGPALGTSVDYEGRNLFGIPGAYDGEGLAYGILDDGNDNLGLRRRNLDPGRNERYRLQLRHRQEMPYGITVLGELGILSDRNFLEQFYEKEFDQGKDVESLLYVKQQFDNLAWTALARPQINEFETTTQWLPKANLHLLSEPFFGGRLTWSQQTSAGFGKLSVSEAPADPTDLFSPLPFVDNAEGAVLMSRHEVDAPFSLGPVRVVPYLLGEAAFWEEGFTSDDIDRFVGSAGVRSSLTFWRVFPNVYSELLNLNGLAHKALVEAEYAFTDSSRNLDEIPQFNEFDDNAQERFRERFLFNTFRGTLPAELEPRQFAVRTGAGRPVSVPFNELVDDQQVVRLAWRHQLQTKVGPPERLRIKDWMTLDLEASIFPRPERDNFGEDLGLLNAFYRWNVSDQTSLLASLQYDLFDNAQQIWNVGFITARSRRGSLFLGIRQVKGNRLDSQIFTASLSYKMSPKWVTTLGTAFDVSEGRNAGQSVTLTRIGADFLVHVGGNFDASKNNAGITVSVEPRLGALKTGLTRLGSLVQ